MLSFELGLVATLCIAMFVVGTYILAGFMREQTCLWLCPYARIQGVMIDKSTVLPTYDIHRGEPRGRINKAASETQRTTGDCIDCNQCVAVCPTGVDIRQGQQEGCITCALCIDACDAVMEKVGRPKGLIRYESLDGLEQSGSSDLKKRPRVWVYSLILLGALSGIVYGLSTLDAIELKVIHERQPLFVMQSDGSIQNKYTLKVLNKLTRDVAVTVTAEGPDGLLLRGADNGFSVRHGNVTARTVFVRVPVKSLSSASMPITFTVKTRADDQPFSSSRVSVFISPDR
jgi:cytochrome c oxidase accessory protein FixG